MWEEVGVRPPWHIHRSIVDSTQSQTNQALTRHVVKLCDVTMVILCTNVSSVKTLFSRHGVSNYCRKLWILICEKYFTFVAQFYILCIYHTSAMTVSPTNHQTPCGVIHVTESNHWWRACNIIRSKICCPDAQQICHTSATIIRPTHPSRHVVESSHWRKLWNPIRLATLHFLLQKSALYLSFLCY